MKRSDILRGVAAVAIAAAASLPLVDTALAAGGKYTRTHEPATREKLESGLMKITLTEKSIERLGIEYAEVEETSKVRVRRPSGLVIDWPAGMQPREGYTLVQAELDEGDLEAVKSVNEARALSIGSKGLRGEWIEAHRIRNGEDKAALFMVAMTEGEPSRYLLEIEITEQENASLSVPYGALIYDPSGRTWVYTSPEANTFLREQVEVDFIEGDQVILKSGPAVGTKVATVGVAELYGEELGVGH